MSEIVIRFVEVLTTIFWIAILARVILSWVPIDQSSPFHAETGTRTGAALQGRPPLLVMNTAGLGE